jgi:hypothetical protein
VVELTTMKARISGMVLPMARFAPRALRCPARNRGFKRNVHSLVYTSLTCANISVNP